ncbi:hypothetical protein, partial [Serratia marcescens]|uniref:hypothetical protein n=1 Tax=Serratia marcescens TaxID=615 RepID=UPI003F827445
MVFMDLLIFKESAKFLLCTSKDYRAKARCLAALGSNLVEASHPPPRCLMIFQLSLQVHQQREDGGGGRIRTFEVSDGRFTVCSLWPL